MTWLPPENSSSQAPPPDLPNCHNGVSTSVTVTKAISSSSVTVTKVISSPSITVIKVISSPSIWPSWDYADFLSEKSEQKPPNPWIGKPTNPWDSPSSGHEIPPILTLEIFALDNSAPYKPLYEPGSLSNTLLSTPSREQRQPLLDSSSLHTLDPPVNKRFAAWCDSLIGRSQEAMKKRSRAETSEFFSSTGILSWELQWL